MREDPLLKALCGSLPESGLELASQPTILRMENAATRRSCHRMARAIFELYTWVRAEGGAPKKVLLDSDAPDDPTHGDQEGSYSHGYYEQHIYHPLLVFDGQTGHLITALLRAGNTHGSNSAVALLRRLVGGLREAWPEVEVELRADAGFAVPALYDYCEQESITDTVGLVSNPRLEGMAEDLLDGATERYETEGEKARLFSEGLYGAASCYRFVANQFRLLLHACAYWPMDALRKKLIESGMRRIQLDTLRLRLVKIGGRVRELVRKIRLHLVS